MEIGTRMTEEDDVDDETRKKIVFLGALSGDVITANSRTPGHKNVWLHSFFAFYAELGS